MLKYLIAMAAAIVLSAAVPAQAAWVMVVDEGASCPDGYELVLVQVEDGYAYACVPEAPTREASGGHRSENDDEGPLEDPHFEGA